MQSAKICLLHSFPLVARRLSVLTQFLYYGSSRLVVKAAAAKKRNSHQNRTESHLRENSSSSQGEMRLQLKKINGGCEGLRWNIQILFTYNALKKYHFTTTRAKRATFIFKVFLIMLIFGVKHQGKHL